ncbi:MAG: class II fructose-bisphosphate aldolase [Chloroflexi bacterium]|nr:class II fructose-bisphosphate aldolase [Chloroflexota bacterium]
MPLVPFNALLAHAARHKYALGYFEAWDQTSFEAVLQAAEEAQAPTILGWGGAITSSSWLEAGGVEEQAALAMALAARSRVPCAVLFNEARTLAQLERALACGANALMLDSSHLPYAENVAATLPVVRLAHAHGAAVEAELGHLAAADDPAVRAQPTEPSEAADFIRATSVDALAVSIGNVHVMTAGESGVDLDRLERIHRAADIPLVIHGGSGYPAWAVRGAVERGVRKFNVGTRFKAAYLDALRQTLAGLPPAPDIQQTIGSREAGDILEPVRARLVAEMLPLLELYGAAGMARCW